VSTASTPSTPSLDTSKLHFLLRRAHSLSGIVPIGMFLMFHLFTNAQIIAAPLGLGDMFQHEVDWIHGTIPALFFVEVFGLWLPIAFHAGLGFWYTFSGSYNKNYNRYHGNWRYLLQRITGMIALVFVLGHIATLRWRFNVLGWFTPFYADASGSNHGDPAVVVTQAGEALPLATASTAMALDHPIVIVFYLVGVLAAVFHWTNGLWTAAISWGITTSEASQKRWGYVCTLLCLTLSGFTLLAVAGAKAYEPTPAEDRAMELLKMPEADRPASLPLIADAHGHIIIDPSAAISTEPVDAPAAH